MNDNLWTEIQQNPELFISEENVDVKLGTSNFTVQTLMDFFFFWMSFLHYWGSKLIYMLCNKLKNAKQ